jgi:thioester reductase-like protein
MNKPIVLLTGATGFLGSHLLEALWKQSHSVSTSVINVLLEF